jgi:hypothetical protein
MSSLSEPETHFLSLSPSILIMETKNKTNTPAMFTIEETTTPSIASTTKASTPTPLPAQTAAIPPQNPEVNLGEEETYRYSTPHISERAVDQARPLKVIYISAGISGILAAIKFRQAVPDLDLTIYEKNPELGGTWFENRYPGCACGMYQYSLLLFLKKGKENRKRQRSSDKKIFDNA